MKILHTSDWHLGRTLNKTRQRYDEFSAFLSWLGALIEQRGIEYLLVCGDIFDTATPTNRAQELYYSFLRRLSQIKCCRHAIIISGNHDSPSFLEAPAALLSGLGIKVIGRSNIENELLTFNSPTGEPELLAAAVPYLREADLKTAVSGETSETRDKLLAEAVVARYKNLRAKADSIISQLGRPIPVVATGHLFLAGGQTVDDDGVREIYAGPLSAIAFEALPKFDYLALGHLHSPQKVGGTETARYSGTPMAMGFNELKGSKSVAICELEVGSPVSVELVAVPVFRELGRLEGELDQLIAGMRKYSNTGAWLELVYTGQAMIPDLRFQLEEEAGRLGLEIVRIRDLRFRNLALAAGETGPDLTAMEPVSIFENLLNDRQINDAERPELLATYREIVALMDEADPKA
ncbi:MAG: exonuclease SbcCD subunit D C-terminal domain-containing protein [Deltaproteobacteria bacterium]|nr:exonuclease SbcCD subunit D C-terminal domain-containing protein [Deltaproteobacteria bacterium]